jgi:hypothetical protein
VVLSRLSEFSPQELSCLINSLSKMAGPDCEADPDPDNTYAEAKLLPPQVVLSSLLEATTPLLPSSSARDLSCILNGIARLGYDPGDEYMALLSQRAIRVAPSFTTQGLATSLNALSRLPPGRAPPSLVRRLAQATHRLLILQAHKKAKDAFTPQVHTGSRHTQHTLHKNGIDSTHMSQRSQGRHSLTHVWCVMFVCVCYV